MAADWRGDPVRIADPLLAEAVGRLAAGSPMFRAGLDTLRRSGFRLLIARPEAVPDLLPELSEYRALHVGEVVPLRDAAGELTGAVVTVDVARLQSLAEAAGVGADLVAADAERILIHEIYGHAVPLSQAGTMAGGCPDPAPGSPARASCAMVRENLVREELGLPARVGYDLSGLSLGRLLPGSSATAR